jgi:hypothetical protein
MITTHPALQAIKWIASHQIKICTAIPLLPFTEFPRDPGKGMFSYLFRLPGVAKKRVFYGIRVAVIPAG